LVDNVGIYPDIVYKKQKDEFSNYKCGKILYPGIKKSWCVIIMVTVLRAYWRCFLISYVYIKTFFGHIWTLKIFLSRSIFQDMWTFSYNFKIDFPTILKQILLFLGGNIFVDTFRYILLIFLSFFALFQVGCFSYFSLNRTLFLFFFCILRNFF